MSKKAEFIDGGMAKVREAIAVAPSHLELEAASEALLKWIAYGGEEPDEENPEAEENDPPARGKTSK